MRKLLTADWHLDDHPDNEYRWAVIDRVIEAIERYQIDEVFNLGDFVDKKDRHSAAFVNRLIAEIGRIAEAATFYVLRGNHDTPLRGPAFWEFANGLLDFMYVTEPTRLDESLMLLPFTPNPLEAWKALELSKYRALFMHVTYPGALSENGRALEGSNLPPLPLQAKIYSGDVHTPQTIRNFVHVGAPHPVKFGDTYPCRMLVLDGEFSIMEEILLSPPQKAVVEVSSIEDLKRVVMREGDQVVVRFSLSPEAVETWGQTEAAIAAWAQAQGVTVARTEALVTAPGVNPDADPEVSPETLLREFAAQEKLSEEMLATGLGLLNEARK